MMIGCFLFCFGFCFSQQFQLTVQLSTPNVERLISHPFIPAGIATPLPLPHHISLFQKKQS